MRRLTIVKKQRALPAIRKLADKNPGCYCLIENYQYFVSLRNKLLAKVEVKNLSGLFDETFQEIKAPFLELITELNKKHNSFAWWGNQLPSRSNSATPLLFNTTSLFCAKKILSSFPEEVIFVVESRALANCISKVALGYEYQVINHLGRDFKYFVALKRYFRCVAQTIYFFWQVLQNYLAVINLPRPSLRKESNNNKNIVIRSWITKGNFSKNGEFQDRNFGILPNWLNSCNCQVWTIPMLFNISMTKKQLYSLMAKQKNKQFLIPEHYLRLSDYLEIIGNSYKVLKTEIRNFRILGVDIVPVINEILKGSFYTSLLILNLSSPMLKRLKEKGFEVDIFYYPFESNAPEKQFILSCRKYFPNSKVIGFQHTVFFPNLLSCHLGPNERECHPLPDKIICSGPIYIELLKKAGFPSEILVSGPNLRFKSVHERQRHNKPILDDEKKLLLPLAFGYDLAFELCAKVGEALRGLKGYRMYIRVHPLLSKKQLIRFLSKIGVDDYEFADSGSMPEWLSLADAVISTGASVTILEAVACAIPVIRIIPDNTFFYDPLAWPDYPLKPVNTAAAIRKQLEFIGEISNNGRDVFARISRDVLANYFTEPTKDNLGVFLS